MATYDGNSLTGNENFEIGDVINFSYSGRCIEVDFKVAFIIKAKVYGAEGGYINSSTRALGGYVEGIYVLPSSKLTFCVGGKGSANGNHATQAGGYNGGAAITTIDSDGNCRPASGGGASHIATTNRGELYNYDSHRDEIIFVAGGGGGCGHNAVLTGRGQPYPKGGAGGNPGGDAYTYVSDQGSNLGAYGSTPDGPGNFVSPFGENIYCHKGIFGRSVAGYSSSGGGGYYGGTCIPYSGAGGASYISPSVQEGVYTTGVRETDGYISVTLLGYATVLDLNYRHITLDGEILGSGTLEVTPGAVVTVPLPAVSAEDYTQISSNVISIPFSASEDMNVDIIWGTVYKNTMEGDMILGKANNTFIII